MPTPDPLSWLRNRVGAEALPGTAFDAAMKFALLWMYFEGQACGTEANPKRLRDFAKDLYARKLAELTGQLESPLEFFKLRYGDVERDPQKFISRLGDPKRIKPDDQNAIISALTKQSLDEVDKAIGLLLICFRIRNNLFHGSKQIPTLQQQEELFVNVGYILIVLLDARGEA
jgi:hypothetical protein